MLLKAILGVGRELWVQIALIHVDYDLSLLADKLNNIVWIKSIEVDMTAQLWV